MDSSLLTKLFYSKHEDSRAFILMGIFFLLGFTVLERYLVYRNNAMETDVSRKMDEAKEMQKIDDQAERSNIRAVRKQHHVEARDHRTKEKRVHTVVHHNIQQPSK